MLRVCWAPASAGHFPNFPSLRLWRWWGLVTMEQDHGWLFHLAWLCPVALSPYHLFLRCSQGARSLHWWHLWNQIPARYEAGLEAVAVVAGQCILVRWPYKGTNAGAGVLGSLCSLSQGWAASCCPGNSSPMPCLYCPLPSMSLLGLNIYPFPSIRVALLPSWNGGQCSEMYQVSKEVKGGDLGVEQNSTTFSILSTCSSSEPGLRTSILVLFTFIPGVAGRGVLRKPSAPLKTTAEPQGKMAPRGSLILHSLRPPWTDVLQHFPMLCAPATL